MTVTLDDNPVTFPVNVSRVDLASDRQDYDDYRHRDDDHGEAERAAASAGVDLDSSLDKDLLWTEAGEADGVTEEALLSKRYLVSVVTYDVLVSKKGCFDLLRSLAGEVQSKRSECEPKVRS